MTLDKTQAYTSRRQHSHRTRQEIAAVLYSTPQTLKDVTAAVHAHNRDEIVRQSHQLSDDFRLIGEPSLTVMTVDLERRARRGDLSYTLSAIQRIRNRWERVSSGHHAESDRKHRGMII